MVEEPKITSKKYINDFRGLEILRFFLSCSVIVWHYQHFFYPYVNYEHRELFLDKQPYFKYFSFFYTEGLFAVHSFWFISGVIFYKIYQVKIFEEKVNFRTYIVNRFSRLYPLHLFTLFIVLVLQIVYHNRNGIYFIYQENTMKTFVQNLLFVQSWGANKFSFNGPTWSVSIELLVYLVFFIFSKAGFLNTFRSLILSCIFVVVLKKWQLVFLTEDLATSFYFFFGGCIFIKLYEMYKSKKSIIAITYVALIISFILILRTPKHLLIIYDQASGRLDLDILIFTVIITLTFLYGFSHKFFDRIPNRIYQFFGDMTYSTYLIHFPIQLGIYLIIRPTDYSIFFSKSFFIIYMLTVLVLGRLVYRYFELPVQHFLRKQILDSKP